jgi:hypothetical protein
VRALFLGLVAAGLIYEQTGYAPPSFEKADYYPLVDRVAERLRGADAAYLVPEVTDPKGHRINDVYGDVFAMWVGLRANVPVVNGYSGRYPPGDYPYGLGDRDGELAKWFSGRFRGKLVILAPDAPAFRQVVVIE